MAPSYGDMLLRALIICTVLMVLSTQRSHAILKYSREDILLVNAQNKDLPAPTEVQDFINFLNSSHDNVKSSHGSHRKRGKRGGLLVKLRNRTTRKPPVPSIIMANIQSFWNKIDELFCRIRSQKDYRDCCVFSFSETWLTPSHPDSALQPHGFTLFRQDRDNRITGKSQGGGVCLLINNNWCTDVKVISNGCTPHIEYLTIKCRPFYMPRDLPL